jgi:hypothetical protein
MGSNIDKYRDVLAGIFTDDRFQQYGPCRWYGEVDITRVGIVLATYNARYRNYGLNKGDYDRLLDAKRSGKLDEAFVVMAARDGNGARVYRDSADAEVLKAMVLADIQPRDGEFGPFYALPGHPDDEPF